MMDNKPLFDDKDETIIIPTVNITDDRPRPRISPETKVNIPSAEKIKVIEEKENTNHDQELTKLETNEVIKTPSVEFSNENITEEPSKENVVEIKKDDIKPSSKKSMITTIVLSVLVGALFLKTLYGFYLGFRYFDLRYDNNTTTINK